MARKNNIKPMFIVYMTTNNVNSKMYIGVHKCTNLNDGYMGSGYAIIDAIKKYGLINFSRKVLFCYDNAKDAYNKEEELVTEAIVNDDNYYNLVGGGISRKSTSSSTSQKHRKNALASGTNSIKITATNIETQQVLHFKSVAECSKYLGIHRIGIERVFRKVSGYTQSHGWTFETEKYGKPLPLKNRNTPKYIKFIKRKKSEGAYEVTYNKKYIGTKKTIEEAKKLLETYLETLKQAEKL